MLNKKIASEIAIGIVLVLAIVIGGNFWMQNQKSVIRNQSSAINNQGTQEIQKQIQEGNGYDKTGMANPASVFCVDHGGKLEAQSDAAGNQVSYCVFENGSKCDEWQYFRGECNKGESVWQTYGNNKFGFEFKYPSDLNVTIDDSTDPEILKDKDKVLEYVNLAKAEDGDILFDLRVDKFQPLKDNSKLKVMTGYWYYLRVTKTSSIDINRYVSSWEKKFKQGGGGIVDPESLLSIRDTTIGGINAKELTFDGGNNVVTSVRFIKGGYAYDLNLNVSELNEIETENARALFYQTLSSFKFSN